MSVQGEDVEHYPLLCFLFLPDPLFLDDGEDKSGYSADGKRQWEGRCLACPTIQAVEQLNAGRQFQSSSLLCIEGRSTKDEGRKMKDEVG